MYQFHPQRTPRSLPSIKLHGLLDGHKHFLESKKKLQLNLLRSLRVDDCFAQNKPRQVMRDVLEK